MKESKMLKNGIEIINRKDLNYIVEDGGGLLKFKPWLGDLFSFLYDFIMKNSVFPKKFGGDINRHYEILRKELEGVHEKNVLELAAGSGSAVNFLPNDNQYTGTDISPGLLRKAVKLFENAGFEKTSFYVTSANELPFGNKLFDVVICILSLNFFDDIRNVLKEVRRVAAKDAIFICSVPVPERNKLKSPIRGTLYSEAELDKICKEVGFRFERIPVENGTLLYFRAILQ
ncbi:MAG TPA: class I SAM-dependent methyltransferase [Candidatus Krumholzibacteriaceae bacterium]|nr:class I SAM-dependent methyltransferase [Candidatus Krumholzibacteriaceae bacterium]